jgi:precorrin-8X/cobalt-precorrin-8 methylmutase
MPEDLHPLALRLVHACGMPEIAPDIAYAGNPVAAGRAALAAGATVLCDARMVEVGIIWDRLPPACRIFCGIDDQRTRKLAEDLGTTRSAAAVELWRPHLDGAVVAIGNAPTALFRLLELVYEGGPRPAAVIGVPVGFVGAAESKEALAASPLEFLIVSGRRGGSAIAAAAVNALAREEE